MRGDQLLRFLAQRLLKLVLLTFALVVVNFMLIHAAPGDPASVMAGQSGAADERYLAQLREQFGLDRPLAEQLWIYVSRVATLDLGISHRMQRPVADLILERLPATLLLSVTAFAFAVAAGIAMGAAAARRAGTVWDSLITALSMVFYCTPLFWTGLLLVLLFSVTLNWLPSFGMSTVGADYTGLRAALDVAEHLVLPALTLGLFYLAVYARLTRSSVLEVAGQDFVKTARAKGVGEGRILRRHVLRNALLPVITIAGIVFSTMLGANVLVEKVFSWPGVASYALDALQASDYAPVQGFVLLMASIFVVVNLLIDILYGIADPRAVAE